MAQGVTSSTTRFSLTLIASLSVAISMGEVDPSGTLTHTAYVQEGLVRLFDAIDNEGTGIHNPNATAWKDLKSTATIAIPGGAVWNDLWLDTHNQSASISSIPDFYYDDVTTEVAVNVISNGPSGYYPRIFVHDGGDGAWTIYYSGTGTGPAIYANSSGTRPGYGVFRKGTISVIGDQTGIYGYVDAITRTSATIGTPGHKLCASRACRIGTTTAGSLTGYYRCFRHYSRALTGDELAHNTAVDGLRYFSFRMTGSGTETPVAWENVAWSSPYAATTTAPSVLTNDFVQISNAKVTISDGQVALRGISLEANAKLALAADAIAWTKALFVGGTEIPRGVYTGTGATGTQVSWLEGTGELRVAGGVNRELPIIYPTAAEDGSFVFGTSPYTIGLDSGKTYCSGEYVPLGQMGFPANPILKFVDGVILDGRLPEDATLDLSGLKYMFLASQEVYPRGQTIVVPSGATFRYMPGSFTSTTGLWYYTAANAELTRDLEVNGTWNVNDRSPYAVLSGKLSGTGLIRTDNFSKEITLKGELAFNGSFNLSGGACGTHVIINSRTITGKFKKFQMEGYSTTSKWRFNSSYHRIFLRFTPTAGVFPRGSPSH